MVVSLSASRPSRWYMVGTPNSIVAPSLQRLRGGCGVEAAEVAQLAAAAQRAEQAEHEPVDVEQRQAVGEDVRRRSTPRRRRARRGWRRPRGAAASRPWAARWCPDV